MIAANKVFHYSLMLVRAKFLAYLQRPLVRIGVTFVV